jgi:parvulin-like peptidyl-prolyl isomerase
MSKTSHFSKSVMRIVLALIGLILILVGSNTRFNLTDYPPDTLVTVNGFPITQSALRNAEKRIQSNSSDPMNPDDRELLLQRLIDDELMLQHAEDLGIFTTDPGIRKLLVRSSVDRIIEDSRSKPISDEQLRTFYEDHKSVFQRPSRLQLKVASFSNPEMAKDTRELIKKEVPFELAIAETKTGEFINIPSSLLPEHVLRRYLGSKLTAVALSLSENQISSPTTIDEFTYLIYLLAKEPEQQLSFDDSYLQVKSEYRSRNRQNALTSALTQLRKDADIQVDQSLLYQRAGGPKKNDL